MQKIKYKLLDGARKVSVASGLPNGRQVIFDWAKYFFQSVKLRKEQILVLSDGIRNKDYLNCYCMYKRTSDAITGREVPSKKTVLCLTEFHLLLFHKHFAMEHLKFKF
jgi:hypothetical protein